LDAGVDGLNNVAASMDLARSLVGAPAVITATGCDQPVDAPGKDHNNRPMT
jgi:hypothetical protein